MFFTALIAALLCLLPADAYAMHIAEGILPGRWALLWFAASAPFVGYGIFKLKRMAGQDISLKPLVGLLAAVVFIISAMPIPVPVVGSVSHPCGTGITSILLGPGISALIASIALLLQALFLAHGGISTLGANTFSMGVAGSLAAFAVFYGLRRMKIGLFASSFLAGLAADWATYLTTSVTLALGIRGEEPFLPLFTKILLAFVPVQVPVGIIEGFVTAGMITLLYKRRVDILIRMKVLKSGEAAA